MVSSVLQMMQATEGIQEGNAFADEVEAATSSANAVPSCMLPSLHHLQEH